MDVFSFIMIVGSMFMIQNLDVSSRAKYLYFLGVSLAAVVMKITLAFI
jgi:hypothetical protein